jgi:hypothetical protein
MCILLTYRKLVVYGYIKLPIIKQTSHFAPLGLEEAS